MKMWCAMKSKTMKCAVYLITLCLTKTLLITVSADDYDYVVLNVTDAPDYLILKYINLEEPKAPKPQNTSQPPVPKRVTIPPDNSTHLNYSLDDDGSNRTFDEAYLDEIRDFIFPKTWTWVLISFHFVVFTVGLVGNTLVCVAVYRNHSMRTVTNYFIVNLAVADFLVILFCLPPSVIWDVTLTWFFGIAMCKIVLYLQESGNIYCVKLRRNGYKEHHNAMQKSSHFLLSLYKCTNLDTMVNIDESIEAFVANSIGDL